jgi:hypothetical protein
LRDDWERCGAAARTEACSQGADVLHHALGRGDGSHPNASSTRFTLEVWSSAALVAVIATAIAGCGSDDRLGGSQAGLQFGGDHYGAIPIDGRIYDNLTIQRATLAIVPTRNPLHIRMAFAQRDGSTRTRTSTRSA